jgi:hypothetical protein
MKRLWISLAAVAVLAAAVVVVHDLHAVATFHPLPLCERPDGSLWRSTSSVCMGYDDPQCTETPCEDSTLRPEGWRHSDPWVLEGEEVGPSGPPPYWDKPAPGAGKPGRL